MTDAEGPTVPSGELRPAAAAVTPAEFARQAHAGQLRKGTDLPYIVHPEGVAAILARLYPGRADLEAAGWLHDTLEDTPTTAHELEARFGPDVRQLVEGVTVRGDWPFHAPKHPDAMRVKAADALDNVTLTIAGLRRGEPVFERFRRGPAKVGYWRLVAVAAARLLGPEPLVSELEAAVAELELLARDAPARRSGCAVAAVAIVVASLALRRSSHWRRSDRPIAAPRDPRGVDR